MGQIAMTQTRHVYQRRDEGRGVGLGRRGREGGERGKNGPEGIEGKRGKGIK